MGQYIVKKKDLSRLHIAIYEIFKNAPKTEEELIKCGHPAPILAGTNHKEYEEEENILFNLFELHTKKKCFCSDGIKCLFARYKNKKITRQQVVSEYKDRQQ